MEQQRLVEILSSGDFGPFIGEVEDSHWDGKREPYRLSDDREKQEYAKDVTALANANGGTIVIGLETAKNPLHASDEVVRVREFDRTLINLDQYRDLLNNWIYPRIANVEVAWHPTTVDQQRGLLSITVPQQEETIKPFLITRHVAEDGRQTEIVFGYTVRNLDRVDHFTVHEIYHLIRQGNAVEVLGQRLDRIEVLIADQLQSNRSPSLPTDVGGPADALLTGRLDDAYLAAGYHGEPAVILSCHALGPVTVPGLFSSGNQGISALIRNPPSVRPNGFNLYTGGEPQILMGQLWRSTRGTGRLLEFWRDGQLTFVAPGDISFLCWSFGREGGGDINPIVLVESTYLFCELARQAIGHCQPPTTPVRLTIQLRNIVSDRFTCSLVPGVPGTADFSFHDNRRIAPAATLIARHDVTNGEMLPEITSYSLVSRVYEWFGFTHDQIPYVADHTVDIGQIVNARRV